jgi:putative spermidine/putrescine transport system permease protein
MNVPAGRIALGAAVGAILLYLIFPVVMVLAISFSSGNFLAFPPPGFSLRFYFVPLGLVNTVLGLACAHAVSGMPFVVINTAASLRSAEVNLERAAIIHGAHPLWAVLRVTLPIIAPGIVIGAILAFVHSAHELLVASFILGGVGKPVAVKIWSGVQATSDPTIAAASAVLIGLAILTFASVAATQSLARRRSA